MVEQLSQLFPAYVSAVSQLTAQGRWLCEDGSSIKQGIRDYFSSGSPWIDRLQCNAKGLGKPAELQTFQRFSREDAAKYASKGYRGGKVV